MKHSIRAKLTVMILVLTAGTIILCWFINNTFLEDFYLLSKEHILENAYYEIESLINSETMEKEEISLKLEKMGANSNITYIVMNGRSGVLVTAYDNVKDNRILENILLPYLLGMNSTNIMKSNEKYSIAKNIDSRYNATYIELFGITEDGYYILLRTPLESIKESVKISNQFLSYVGIFVVLFSVILMIFITKRFTRPILELAEIAQKMKNLNFNIKYTRHDKDEIGILGNSMNELSEKLEITISELKSANNELQKDIEQKTQIDEMRKEFLSNVSHELKTPIALIQGYAEGLQEGINDDAESRQFYCEVIMDEANKMNKMVKKLLTLNQIEFGQEQTTMEHFDLTALIQGVLQSVDILAKQNQIQILFKQIDSVYVWADEYQIEEVVTNYISNAIHHAAFEKRIEVNIERKEATARVSVFNTGNPIPQEDINKIWIKFYKVDKARTREYGGSGIGLSIVKAIMDSHHKECGVSNRENGVEFWFEVDCQNNIV